MIWDGLSCCQSGVFLQYRSPTCHTKPPEHHPEPPEHLPSSGKPPEYFPSSVKPPGDFPSSVKTTGGLTCGPFRTTGAPNRRGTLFLPKNHRGTFQNHRGIFFLEGKTVGPFFEPPYHFFRTTGPRNYRTTTPPDRSTGTHNYHFF